RRPSVTVGEPLEHRFDAARPVKPRRTPGFPVHADLLVLRADPPLAPRLRPRGEIVDQRILAGDRSFELGRRLNQIGHPLPHTAAHSPLPEEWHRTLAIHD